MRRFDAGFRVAHLPQRMNQPGGWPRLETGRRLTAAGFDYSVLCHLPPVHTRRESCSYLESEPARDCRRRPESGWTRKRWCSSHPFSSPKSREGAPPARQRALKTRGGRQAARLDTSAFRSPGTTQLVDGAALIQRYRQVRFLGARPHAAGVTGKRGLLLRERFRVRVSGGVRSNMLR